MQYYLDTSAIYEIKKLPKSVVKNSFYSALSMVEIIAGVDQKSFIRRKAALTNILNTEAKFDDTFPEKLTLQSFDFYNDYSYEEERINDLIGLAENLVIATSLDAFLDLDLVKGRKYPFDYFVTLDKRYSDGFVNAAKIGRVQISSSLENTAEDKSVSFEDKTFQLDSRRAIINFMEEDLVNDSFTISGLADGAISISGEEYSDELHEKVYKTYNGSLSHYIAGFSNYSIRQIADNSLPDRNDSQDLIHLLYLRNDPMIKILSNDGFFLKTVPKNSITIKGVFLQTLISILGVSNESIPVIISPADEAIEKKCFQNVLARVEKHGGECVYGWQIWSHDFMLEAEFHAVWKNPEGNYIDLTPNPIFKEQSPPFYIDLTKTFEGKQVNNVRLNITSNGLVDDFIALHNFKFVLENKGENAFRFENLLMNDGEIRAWNFTKDMINSVQVMITSKSNVDSICFCGRNKAYNQCHGQDLINGLKQMEAKFMSY